MRPIALLAPLALTSCATHHVVPRPAAPARPVTTTAARAPHASHPAPSDGYAVTQLGHLRLFSRRLGEHRFVLMQQRLPDGRPQRARGVRPAPFPFDVDLGTDAHRRTVAVYTRCHIIHSVVDDSVTPEHCVPVLKDPTGGPERRLDALAALGQSATWPSIDRGRIAFARTSDDPDHVTVWRAASPSASPRRLARLPLLDVAGLQARGRLVALTGFAIDDRFGQVGLGSSPVLLLGDAGAPVEELAEGGLGEETDSEPRGLTFIGDGLVWALGDLSGEEDVGRSAVQRYDLRTGSRTSADVRGALTGLAGTSLDGLVAADARAPETRQGGVPAHVRLRRLGALDLKRVDGGNGLGEHVLAP